MSNSDLLIGVAQETSLTGSCHLSIRFHTLNKVGSEHGEQNFLSASAQEWHATFIHISFTKVSLMPMHNLKNECSWKERRIRIINLWENNIYHSLLFWSWSIMFTLLSICRTHLSPTQNRQSKSPCRSWCGT